MPTTLGLVQCYTVDVPPTNMQLKCDTCMISFLVPLRLSPMNIGPESIVASSYHGGFHEYVVCI